MKRGPRVLPPGLGVLLAANNPANRNKLEAAVAACDGCANLTEREAAVLEAAVAYLKAPNADSEATLSQALHQAVAGSIDRPAGRWPTPDQWWQI